MVNLSTKTTAVCIALYCDAILNYVLLHHEVVGVLHTTIVTHEQPQGYGLQIVVNRHRMQLLPTVG